MKKLALFLFSRIFITFRHILFSVKRAQQTVCENKFTLLRIFTKKLRILIPRGNEMENSQTLKNLARSFAGESQAGLRYQIIADLCIDQGYPTLADELKTIAKNEVQHAKTYYHLLTNNGGAAQNIEICAGYPFEKITIEDGLKEAMLAEKEEAEKVYPEFAKIAKAEGFLGIAKKFELTAKVEKEHELKFKYLYENFKNGTLFQVKEPVYWECSVCGHKEAGVKAWNVCPLCNSTQGFVKLKLN